MTTRTPVLAIAQTQAPNPDPPTHDGRAPGRRAVRRTARPRHVPYAVCGSRAVLRTWHTRGCFAAVSRPRAGPRQLYGPIQNSKGPGSPRAAGAAAAAVPSATWLLVVGCRSSVSSGAASCFQHAAPPVELGP